MLERIVTWIIFRHTKVSKTSLTWTPCRLQSSPWSLFAPWVGEEPPGSRSVWVLCNQYNVVIIFITIMVFNIVIILLFPTLPPSQRTWTSPSPADFSLSGSWPAPYPTRQRCPPEKDFIHLQKHFERIFNSPPQYYFWSIITTSGASNSKPFLFLFFLICTKWAWAGLNQISCQRVTIHITLHFQFQLNYETVVCNSLSLKSVLVLRPQKAKTSKIT